MRITKVNQDNDSREFCGCLEKTVNFLVDRENFLSNTLDASVQGYSCFRILYFPSSILRLSCLGSSACKISESSIWAMVPRNYRQNPLLHFCYKEKYWLIRRLCMMSQFITQHNRTIPNFVLSNLPTSIAETRAESSSEIDRRFSSVWKRDFNWTISSIVPVWVFGVLPDKFWLFLVALQMSSPIRAMHTQTSFRSDR